MKPKIQLVGGCASSFENEAQTKLVRNSANVEGTKAGDAGALLEELLATIIKSVGASAGIVRVLSPDGREFKSIASSGLPLEISRDESVAAAGCGVCGQSANNQKIESSDAEYCMSRYGANFFAQSCQYVQAVPLLCDGKESDPAGVLTLFYAAERDVTEEIKRTLQSYADLVQIALKRVWQSEDSHQLNLLAERQSIANEIHDSLAQTLYFAKIRSSLLLDALKTDNELLAFKCAQDIDEALDNSQKTVRELVTHFRCQMDPRGLHFALQKLVNDFTTRTGISLVYDNQLEKIELPLEFELQIFLIVRESLVNIATHSGATVAGLTVAHSNGQYKFTVEDNGDGVGDGSPIEGHYGLAIMRERAIRIGGAVEVESLQGLGTRVQLSFGAPGA